MDFFVCLTKWRKEGRKLKKAHESFNNTPRLADIGKTTYVVVCNNYYLELRLAGLGCKKQRRKKADFEKKKKRNR